MSMFGKRVRARREELGWSQEELAFKMGYKTKSSINKIELGHNNVYQSTIVKFSEVLGVSISYLMGWEDEEIEQASKAQEDSLQDLGSVDKAINDELLAFAESWMQEVGEIHFNDEEYKQITNYAKFVLNQRN